MEYSSVELYESSVLPGVTFKIRKMSAGRRLELLRSIRELVRRNEFHGAGSTMNDRLESGILSIEADRHYLEAGLAGIEGLQIDGVEPTSEVIWDLGPEAFTRELVEKVRENTHLSEEARKN